MRRVGGRIRNREASDAVASFRDNLEQDRVVWEQRKQRNICSRHAAGAQVLRLTRWDILRCERRVMVRGWHIAAAAAAMTTIRMNAEQQLANQGTALEKVAQCLRASLLFKGLSGWKRNKGRLTLTSSRAYFDSVLTATDTRLIYSSPLSKTNDDSDEEDDTDTAHHRQLMQKMLHRVDGCIPSPAKWRDDSPGRYSAADSLRLVKASPGDTFADQGARSFYQSDVKRHQKTTDSRNLVRKLTGELLLHHAAIVQNSDPANPRTPGAKRA